MKKESVITYLLGAATGMFAAGKIFGKLLEKQRGKVDKFKSYYNMLNQWIQLRQRNVEIKSYLRGHGYKTVAIYGMGEMGMRLYEELKNTDVTVKYAVDRQDANLYPELKIYSKEESLNTADIMIVTAIFDFKKIESEMKEKTDFPVISLETIIYELFMSSQ